MKGVVRKFFSILAFGIFAGGAFLFPIHIVQANIGMTPPEFWIAETIQLGESRTATISILRNGSTQPTGDVYVEVSSYGDGGPYIFGDDSFMIPDGSDSYAYTFEVIPYEGASGELTAYVQFLQTELEYSGQVTGNHVVAGVTAPVHFTAPDATPSTSPAPTGGSCCGAIPEEEPEEETEEAPGDTEEEPEEESEEETEEAPGDTEEEPEEESEEAPGDTEEDESSEPEESEEEESEGSQTESIVTDFIGGDGSVILQDEESVVVVEEFFESEKTDVVVQEAITIASPSHPDEQRWYSSQWVTVNWELESDGHPITLYYYAYESIPMTTAGGASFSTAASGAEGQIYQTLSPQIQLFLQEGQHIIYVFGETANGFTDVVSKQILIDSTPPVVFEPTVYTYFDVFLRMRHKLLFEGQDVGSGVSGYEVYVDGEYNQTNEGTFLLPELEPGEHLFEVRAFDNSGNFRSSYAKILVDDGWWRLFPWAEGLYVMVLALIMWSELTVLIHYYQEKRRK
jgi:hypothetical protein